MREALTLVSYKAAKERHWNEAEEDDEEDCPTDYTLGLRAAKEGTRKHGEGKYNTGATIASVNAGDSHFLFGCFIQIHSVQSGGDEMIFKRRNEFQCSQAAKRRQQDVYNQRQDGNW